MNEQLNLVQAFQVSINIIKLSLKQIEEWETDTMYLEELLRINSRGWELFLKTYKHGIMQAPLKSTHITADLYKFALENRIWKNDIQNLYTLANRDLHIKYFEMLDDLVNTKSRYNVINEFGNKEAKYYLVDKWYKENIHGKSINDFHENLKETIQRINQITLRYFYFQFQRSEEYGNLSVILFGCSNCFYNEFYS